MPSGVWNPLAIVTIVGVAGIWPLTANISCTVPVLESATNRSPLPSTATPEGAVKEPSPNGTIVGLGGMTPLTATISFTSRSLLSPTKTSPFPSIATPAGLENTLLSTFGFCTG